MKDKIALWGADEKDNDLLIVLRLRALENRVDLWTFPKDKHSPLVLDSMGRNWDTIDTEQFEQPYEYIERTMAEPTLLPDHIRTRNAELIAQVEREWYFKVLSVKLKASLEADVDRLLEQVRTEGEYKHEHWTATQSLWNRAEQHFQARDLNREQITQLKDKLNALFDEQKLLRRTNNKQFEEENKRSAVQIMEQIDRQMEQLSEGRLENSDVFENLKLIQVALRDTRLSRELRTDVVQHLNEAFEQVRQDRRNNRHKQMDMRLRNLQDTMDKLSKSLQFDHRELEFQQQRIGTHAGQLETQLREAQIAMLEEKINSKTRRIGEMQQSYAEMQARMQQQQQTASQKLDEAVKPTQAPAGSNDDDMSVTTL